MSIKKLLSAGFGAACGLALAAGSAHATSIADTIYINELNQWSDNSAERIGVDHSVNGSPTGVLDVGDTLRGIFQIETLEDQSGGNPSINYGSAGVHELSGIFEVEVKAIQVVSDPNNSCGGVSGCTGGAHKLDGDERVNYVFGPNAAFQSQFGGLSGSTMVVFFEDATPDFTRTGTVAAGEASATDGTKVVELGFSGDADEYWVSTNTPSKPGIAKNVPQGTGLGTFSFGVAFLFNSLFNQWVQVDSGCVILPGGCAGDGLVDVNGSGGVSGTKRSTTKYDIFDNVDLVFRPVPEPGTLGMLGIGLVGLGFFARTRRQQA